MEPGAAAALARQLVADRRSKAVAIDGWTALNAFIPPKERRGLTLIDPPFEAAGEFARLAQSLEAAHRKWAGGVYLAWYPVKDRAEPDALARRLERARIGKVLRVEFSIAPPGDAGRLAACGLIAVNPPWTLPDELAILLPELARVLSDGGAGRSRVDWATGER
jgi:23S rRNA (adenine2030-N6)-methyltransferase